ncbi:MAG: lysine--tRNA ligase [Acidimicrobiia bacterium]
MSDDQRAGSAGSAGSLDEQRRIRADKVAALRRAGIDPYPDRFERSATSAELHERFGSLEPGAETGVQERVAGRVMLRRNMGKLIFLTIQDLGGQLQLFVSKAELGDEGFAAVADIDLGDWVGATGEVITTRKGELSVKVAELQLLAKALRPLPDKWRGLSDTDTRYRQRYVDLIVNEEARRTFRTRHQAVRSLRNQLDEEGFIEVETPVLQLEAGGATARPFVTHHNALDQQMYLRIALELHLKRLVVGGIERVYEIGRVFRNEGISTRHNPEFTMVEVYWALANYDGMIGLTERMICRAALDATGGYVVAHPDRPGATIDLTPPWPRRRIVELIAERTGETVSVHDPVERLREVCDRLGVAYEDWWGSGKLVYTIFDKQVEDTLGHDRPMFAFEYPAEVSPLAKPSPGDAENTDRFELFIGGKELANGYSELNDPVRQRAMFEMEVAAAEHGDDEAARTVDEDYLRALEFGLPPTGGLGVGIDRLAMLLSGQPSIREVILFPTLRPEQAGEDDPGAADPDGGAEPGQA